MMTDKKYGLIPQFTRLLLAAGLACVLLFFALHAAMVAVLNSYFDQSGFRERETARQIQSFQGYADTEGLASTDTAALTRWVKRSNVLILELYRGGTLVYSSAADGRSAEGQQVERTPFYDWMPSAKVQLADGSFEAVFVYDAARVYYMYGTILLVLLCAALFLSIFVLGCRRIVRYICLLSAEVEGMKSGDLDHAITVQGKDELALLASDLDAMRIALRQQHEEEAQAAAKVKSLVTEMSHDLRTPLTTLLLYTEIVRGRKYTSPAQLQGYLDKIDAKAQQLKQMSDKLFEYALVTKDSAAVLDPPACLSQIFEQPLAEMVDQLQRQGFACALELGSEDVRLIVCEQYVRRILDNITSNILKYADPRENVTVRFVRRQGCAGLAFGNMALPELDSSASTRVGLVSIQTMMEKMRAQSLVEQQGRAFCITLLFPVCG